MKYFVTSLGLVFLFFTTVSAESDPEMERLQRQLNCQTFGGCDDAPVRQPPPPPPPESKPEPEPEPEPIAKAEPPEPAPATDSGPPLSTFTNYKLEGVSIGMLEADVLAALAKAGYQCNSPQANAMKAYFPGHQICIYFSMESPRILHFAVANGKMVEIEYTEEFDGGFPPGLFEKEKAKFNAKFPGMVVCKAHRRGERCDVVGHGYRISLRSKERRSKASLSYSINQRR